MSSISIVVKISFVTCETEAIRLKLHTKNRTSIIRKIVIRSTAPPLLANRCACCTTFFKNTVKKISEIENVDINELKY